MISIIQELLFRLKKSKLFWTMFGLCIGLPILSLLLTVSVAGAAEGVAADYVEGGLGLIDILKEMGLTVTELNEFPQLISTFSLFALITTSVVLSKEFTDGTMRNVILANKSRKQMYFAYQIVALGVGIVYMLAQFVTVMLTFAPIFGFGKITAGEATSACFCALALGLLATVFVQSCMCMFLFVIRKQWATVLLPLVICMFGPGIIEFILMMIELSQSIKQGLSYVPMDTSWIPLINASLFNAADLDGGLVGKIALYYSVLSAVFMVGGYFTFEKTDLK